MAHNIRPMEKARITEELEGLVVALSRLKDISPADQQDVSKLEKWKGLIESMVVKGKSISENENLSEIEQQLLQIQVLLAQGLLEIFVESAEAKRIARPS